MKAAWNGVKLAESDQTVIVEGNHYFPPDSIEGSYFEKSGHHTHCGWKGDASYYHVRVNGELNENAAWYYPDPLEAAENIKGYIAFWHGVEVSK